MTGIVTLDLHGMNRYQAKIALDSALRRADASVYRVVVIHGYHGGGALRAERGFVVGRGEHAARRGIVDRVADDSALPELGEGRGQEPAVARVEGRKEEIGR